MLKTRWRTTGSIPMLATFQNIVGVGKEPIGKPSAEQHVERSVVHNRRPELQRGVTVEPTAVE